MTVGFIGLGLMGSRMAANMQKKADAMVVYNRTPEKADALVKAGARRAASPEEVGAACDIVFTMLTSPQVVGEVATGDHGFLDAMREETLWVDCSTVNPSFSRTMARFASERGVRFVDAPVAGSTGPAERGELLVLAGGNAKDISEAQPFLDAIGKKTVHVGENGKGASMKLVVNLMLAQSAVAFSEAVKLGTDMGIPRQLVLDTLIGGPLTAPFLAGKKGNFESDSYDVEFPLTHITKDVHLAIQTAYETGTPAVSAAVAAQLFARAKKDGLGEKDFTAIFRSLNE